MSSHVSDRLFSIFLRVAFVFEPLAPRAISYLLTRRLNELKNRGEISDYKTRTSRLGRFHYKVEIDLEVTGKQAFHVLDDLLPDRLKLLGR
jgi:hypothetical protein